MRIAAVSLFMTVVLLAALPSVSSANCPAPGANQRCLDQPPVNAASTNEPGFGFPAGSTVRFQADGCEQTGGSGATWKRYVNPDPPNGVNQYHGKVGIVSSVGGPVTLALTRLLDIQNASFRPTTASFLQVGFEDDGYGDNSYSSHDNGTNNQCAWSSSGPLGTFYGPFGYGGPAYIMMTTTPDQPPSVTAAQPPAFVTGPTNFSVPSSSDPEGDARTYTYLVDGAAIAAPTTATTQTWNSAGDGPHTLAIRATDQFGASADSATRTFSVDNTAPTVSILTALHQVFPPGSNQTWPFVATDAGSGVASVACRVDGIPVTCSGPSSHTTSGLPPGEHTFAVQATDHMGHASLADSRTFTILAPEVTPTPTPTPTPVVVEATPTPAPPPTTVAGPVATPAHAAPTLLVPATVSFAYDPPGTSTRLTRLQVKNLPAGSTVTLTCTGKGCARGLKKPGFTKAGAAGTLSLAKFIKRPFKAGVRLTVVIANPAWLTTTKVLTIRSRKAPTLH
jgi:hypothetical protein